MTIWQLEQERQIGWKNKTHKKSTKNNFYLFLFFFQGTSRMDSNLPLWISECSYFMKRSLNPLAILAH